MLLILSRLALKHDLEIRELQAAKTNRTMLVQARRPRDLIQVTKPKEGQRPPGEPHVHGWAAMMKASTTDTALSSEDKQKVAAYTSSANSLETLLQSIYWSQFKKNISEGLGQVAVFRGPPDSAHVVPHHQSHESEGRQREVRPGSSGGAAFANSNKCSTISDASWRQERRTAIADLLATYQRRQVLYSRVQKTAEEDSGY